MVFGSPTHAIVAPSCDQRGWPSLPQLVLIFSILSACCPVGPLAGTSVET